MPLSLIEQQLVTDNHNLIYSFANSKKLDLEEYYGVLALALCKAAQHFDKSKGEFSTFAYICMTDEVINDIRMNKRKRRTLPESFEIIYLDAPLCNKSDDITSTVIVRDIIPSQEVNVDRNYEGKETYKMLLSLLNDKEYKIVQYKLMGLTNEQIARKMRCSAQNINYYIFKIKKKWINKMGGSPRPL